MGALSQCSAAKTLVYIPPLFGTHRRSYLGFRVEHVALIVEGTIRLVVVGNLLPPNSQHYSNTHTQLMSYTHANAHGLYNASISNMQTQTQTLARLPGRLQPGNDLPAPVASFKYTDQYAAYQELYQSVSSQEPTSVAKSDAVSLASAIASAAAATKARIIAAARAVALAVAVAVAVRLALA